MKIKTGINYIDFLNEVQKCSGEVLYRTTGGDCLNLKSLLSKFLFVSTAINSDLIQDGEVTCKIPDDYSILSIYLEEV